MKWHPNGLAIDVMIPNHNTDEGIELGNQIAGLALANAKRWGVIHVIWRQGFYPGIGAPSWTADYGNEDRQPLRPCSHRHRRRRIPDRARNLLHRIDESRATQLTVRPATRGEGGGPTGLEVWSGLCVHRQVALDNGHSDAADVLLR